MFVLAILLAVLIISVVIIYLSWHFYQLLPPRLTYRKTLTVAIMLVLFGLIALRFVVFGFLVNFAIAFVLLDILSMLVYKFEKPKKYWAKVSQKGSIIIGASLLLSVYGIYNAHNIDNMK